MTTTQANLLDLRPDVYRQDGFDALERARNAVTTFKALDADASSTVLAETLDSIQRELNKASGMVHLFTQVHPEDEIRDIGEELERAFSAFGTELSLDREMYDRLAAIDLDAVADPLERRLFEHALRNYRRSGVDRDEATRKRITELKAELVEVGQGFDRNIIAGGREFVIEDGHAGLAGLPQDFKDAHPEDENGHVTITTDAQDRMPFMTFAERGDLRKAYHHLCANRAYPENEPVLQTLLEKRHELATLLGYANWADYVTEDKMVGSGAKARDFIERVLDLSRERAEREDAELLAEKRKDEPDAETLFEFERAYYAERVRRAKYDFDSQSVRPYLPYDKVSAGVFDTMADLFGVTFERNHEVPVWHASVEVYDVVEDGAAVARIYCDMHPRENKFKHAAMFNKYTGFAEGGIPEGCIVCNFPEPKDGDPGLMLFDQVTTFFHEVGHLLHYVFSKDQRFVDFGGIATEWDFVEVPSQLNEEWAWDLDVLQSFAKHHETDEPLPAELFEKMRRAEEYGKGMRTRTQMFYALLSLSYYERDPKGLDTTERMIELKTRITPTPHEEGTHMQCSFGHLHGYSAMYYTYMWSLVISKDFYSRFEGDLMNTGVAQEYRAKVTARGGEKDADQLCEDFLGRPYGFDAFEAYLNA